MVNVKPQNCWEFWNCPQETRDECPAFLTFHGRECFEFADDYCPRTSSGIQKCSDCAWYKKISSEADKKEKGSTRSNQRKGYFKS